MEGEGGMMMMMMMMAQHCTPAGACTAVGGEGVVVVVKVGGRWMAKVGQGRSWDAHALPFTDS